MPLILFVLLVSLTTKLHPAAPSAAADVKRASELKKNHPIAPDRIVNSIYALGGWPTEAQFETVKNWLREDPRNKNAEDFVNGRSILMTLVMTAIAKSSSIYNSLLDILLSLEPDIRYQTGRDEIPSTALQIACWYAPEQESNLTPENQKFQIRLAKTLIDLMLKQDFTYADITAELSPVLANIDSGIKRIAQLQGYTMRAWHFSKQVTLAAQEYLHDLRAAEIAEEELKKYLLPELAPIGAEYIAPRKQKGTTQTSPAGKTSAPSGSGKQPQK